MISFVVIRRCCSLVRCGSGWLLCSVDASVVVVVGLAKTNVDIFVFAIIPATTDSMMILLMSSTTTVAAAS